MRAFGGFDRYDFALSILFGLIMVGAILLGAGLGVVVAIMFVLSVIATIRHYNDIVEPAAPAPARKARPERVRKHSA
jgi:hypothetical protein